MWDAPNRATGFLRIHGTANARLKLDNLAWDILRIFYPKNPSIYLVTQSVASDNPDCKWTKEMLRIGEYPVQGILPRTRYAGYCAFQNSLLHILAWNARFAAFQEKELSIVSHLLSLLNLLVGTLGNIL